ncbi:MAG TPA: hypothetical protein VH206_09635 [Xanthobacteraceae bacterium]|jgi:hypothetical protein|nr:hypothetical protein [Xanthobacteraceae bacterium]
MPHGEIADYYDKIFAKDPLLLDEGSQIEYRDGLLKHLLLNRTMHALAPVHVDLQVPAEIDAFKWRPPLVGEAPPEEVMQEYRECRAKRTELEDQKRFLLEKITMVSRGKYTARRTKGIFPTHAAAIRRLKKAKAKSSIDKRLRIAAVGYRVQVSKLESCAHLNEELCILPKFRGKLVSTLGEHETEIDLGRTMASSNEALAEWKSAILNHIDTALAQNCHFIVLPEFALPSSSDGNAPIESELYDRCSKRELADHFMFAGSRHEGGSNRGLVLSKQGEDVNEPFWHHKVAPARGLGENIFGPYGTKRASYSAIFDIRKDERPRFPIDIAICYDTFDPTMFLSLVLQSKVSGGLALRPRMMLVPSFNTSRDFVALLRDLSFLSRSIVVYVNGLHGDAKMYIAGFAISDFSDPKRVNEIRRQLREKAKELKSRRDEILSKYARDDEEATAEQQLRARTEALTALEKALQDLQRDRALDGIITLQDQPDANSISGRHDPSDLLYYNIDMGLINALLSFRADYFAGDLFLPEPFRYDRLRAAAQAMRKNMEQGNRPTA